MTPPDDLVDLVVEDDRWTAALPLDRIAAESAAAALAVVGLGGLAAEISLLACNDARIAELNGSFRDKAQATNVLSWPAFDLSPPSAGQVPEIPVDETPVFLGDIAIAYDTVAREAAEARKSLSDHTRHLVVHSTLHLLGFDHIDDADAVVMEELEVMALASMGLSNPY